MEKSLNRFQTAMAKSKIQILYGVLTILVALSIFSYQNSTYYNMYLNGALIGPVNENTAIEETFTEIENSIKTTYGQEAHFQKEVTFERAYGQVDNLQESELKAAVQDQLVVYKPAAAIVIDEEQKMVVDTKEQAESFLELIKKPFEEEVLKKENIELLEIDFGQDVKIVEADFPVNQIINQNQAVAEIENKREGVESYEVAQGDTAWTISRSLDTGLREIEEANPDMDIEDLKPGDTIKLAVEKPYIDVVIKAEELVTEEIDFETEEKKTSDLYVGQRDVDREGEKGEKEITKAVTYVNGAVENQEVIDEKVLKEPVDEVVLVGTKQRPVVTTRSSSSRGSSSPAPTYNGETGSAIVRTAKAYLGTPYRYGGTTPAGFDCSGFVQYVYRQYGISLPRTASAQGNTGAYVSRGNLRPGDIVYFSGHSGIYVGGNTFIHSPRPGRVVSYGSMNSSYWSSRFIAGRRPY